MLVCLMVVNDGFYKTTAKVNEDVCGPNNTTTGKKK